MSRSWKPESRVAVTEERMVIQIATTGFKFGVRPEFKDGVLTIRGQHEQFGAFEIKFDIPERFNPASIKTSFGKGTVRFEFAAGKMTPFFSDFPKSMLIYCKGCEKHFDIVITGKGPANYTCPACGKVQVFDLEALVKRAMEQSKGLGGKKRGRL